MKTKVCGTCKKRRTAKNFYKKSASSNGLTSKCKECSDKYKKEHYERNRQRYIDQAKIRNKRYLVEKQEIVRSAKSQYGCSLCEETDHCCLDFHHLDPQTKIDTICNMSQKKSAGIKTLVTEINKCVCVCSNCHRKIHAGKLKVYKRHLCKITVH